MLRRAYRPVVGGNRTKRPVGGRANPCATHRDPSHPLALVSPTARSLHRRRQQIRQASKPGWRLFSEAVQSGTIPVGVELTEKAIIKATGLGVACGFETLALQLSSRREPVRLRQIRKQSWVAHIL